MTLKGDFSCWKRSRRVLLIGATSMLMLTLLLLMYYALLYGSNIPSDRIRPVDFAEHFTISTYLLDKKPSLPDAMKEALDDEDASLIDVKKLVERITQTAKYDETLWTNGEARFKRETTRQTRDCDMSAERCKTLLQTIQSYLETLSRQFVDVDQVTAKDILKCLRCTELLKTQQSTVANEPDVKSATRPDDRYDVERDRSNDTLESDIMVIELLNDDKTEDSSRHDNRTKEQPAAKVASDASRDAAHGSSTDASIDRFDLIGEVSSTVSPENGPFVNNSFMKERNNESAPVIASNFVERHRSAKSQTAVSSVMMLQIVSSSTTEATGNIVVSGNDDAASSETPNYEERVVAIVGNTTSERSTGRDVTGIDNDDGTTRPSTYPPFEGDPEDQSVASANDIVMAPSDRDDGDFRTSDENELDDSGQVEKSAKGFQELSPMVSWTIPHPICFYGSIDQFFSSKQSPSTFFPSFPFASQQHGFSPGLGAFSRQTSSPNYVQEQEQSAQSAPRFSYASYLAQLAHPAGSSFGPTGPAVSSVPIFSLNQPTATTSSASSSSSSLPNEQPYTCTYVSFPTLQIPPFANAPSTWIGRPSSEEEAKNLSAAASPKSFDKDSNSRWPYNLLYPNMCPSDSRQCGNGFCVLRVKWCDGRVDCTDASDEAMCSCRDRIFRDRLCDGYFDCPHGEDELGCFDCPEDSFSCDDWDQRYNLDNCVPLSQRCDGIEQCRNGRDELDCNILSASYIEGKNIFTDMIGYTQGYLHKNIRGQWYPVCWSEFSWVMDACASESGQSVTITPEVQVVRLPDNAFHGPYVKGIGGQTQFVASCSNSAVFVKCPPLPCGTRVLPHRDSPVTARDIAKDRYVYKRHTVERLSPETANFDQLYQEMLGLLDRGSSFSEEKAQSRNDTLVGAQLRVVGGRASRPKAWPFLVAIYKDGDFHCGGVILNEVWILTAAHCMDGYEAHYYEVQAGILRRFSFSPMVQSRRVRSVVIHNGYQRRYMQNDIAMVLLDQPLLFNRWVRQICLPAVDSAGREWKTGPTSQSTCIAIGWGATREKGPDLDHLREVEVPILSSCKYSFDRNDATICAGLVQGGHDACQGDSGGPLMCRNPNLDSQWYVAGIISHGDGCGRPNEPGVYTKVSHFVQWIQEASEKYPISSNESRSLSSCPGFSCQTGLGKCLPSEKRCDRIVDCLDAEDEIDCASQMGYWQYPASGNELLESALGRKSSGDTSAEETEVTTAEIFVSTAYEDSTKYNESPDAIERTTSSERLPFTCASMIQTITIDKRCDRRPDCQDGTDEDGCTCRDFLQNSRPAAICDGHLDCDDETDEKDCGTCRDDEFRCSRSGTCVPRTSRCDAAPDCPLREDEVSCFALTDGERVNLDRDDWPDLNAEGLLSRYANGTWRVECPQLEGRDNDTATKIGRNVCAYLGFAGLRSIDTVVVNGTELEETKPRRRRSDNAATAPSPRRVGTSVGDVAACTALRIRCRPVLSGSADAHLVVDPRTGSRAYLWPWLAAIFVDGRYRCSALLLEPDWLLSSSKCTEDIRLTVNYTTALLGQSRSYLHVDGPYQQISAIDEIKDAGLSGVALLHLRTAANITRHALPLFRERRIYPAGKSDLCVAVGTDEEYVTRSVFLQPVVQGCSSCHRCFVGTSSFECPANDTSSKWSGVVFCRGQNGWYPAAVFNKNDSLCSFRNPQNLTSIDYVHAYITQALEEKTQPVAEPTCDGVRCNIGRCISWNRVCDGVVDCRDGADERTETCDERIRRIGNETRCVKSELRCGNGECVPKSAFCDGRVDCSDGTDEPVRCTCAEYLRRTAPTRLCDGVRHCFDKTDESPEECRCTETSFKCNQENQNLTCVSQDFVCDDDKDCPNGEDEERCQKLEEFAQNRPGVGEVKQRSYGVWHSQCFSAPVTSQEDAKAACEKLGYANGTIDHETRASNEPIVPSRDGFYMIRLNTNIWMTMRDDKPLVTLARPEVPCYRLFVRCI